MGQLDVIRYPEGTAEICEDQGMLAVTLRVIKALEISGVSDKISEDYIHKAEEAYRSYYDPGLKRVRPLATSRMPSASEKSFRSFSRSGCSSEKC